MKRRYNSLGGEVSFRAHRTEASPVRVSDDKNLRTNMPMPEDPFDVQLNEMNRIEEYESERKKWELDIDKQRRKDDLVLIIANFTTSLTESGKDETETAYGICGFSSYSITDTCNRLIFDELLERYATYDDGEIDYWIKLPKNFGDQVDMSIAPLVSSGTKDAKSTPIPVIDLNDGATCGVITIEKRSIHYEPDPA